MPAPFSDRRSAWPKGLFQARRFQFAAILPLLACVAGCGLSNEDKFAPACPRTSIIASAADLTRFRADPAAGAGEDVTDMVLGGRITGVSGTCQRAEEDTLDVTATVGFDLTRGPASRSRTEDVPFFVAVVQGEQILDKRVFRIRVDFPANTDRQRLTSEEVHLLLPITRAKSGASYDLLVG
ncbi:MAG: hypothetical protein JOZ42_16045, partial [Acetobacteraceae bacterium]|nr:hypothetical protein [Acetobacteraceae bacterium]